MIYNKITYTAKKRKSILTKGAAVHIEMKNGPNISEKSIGLKDVDKKGKSLFLQAFPENALAISAGIG